jgi:hypothetical protein
MDFFRQAPELARKLAAEELPQVFFPVCRRNHPHEPRYSLCSCGKGFVDIASKKADQAWYHQSPTRESERPLSMSRLLGSEYPCSSELNFNITIVPGVTTNSPCLLSTGIMRGTTPTAGRKALGN